MVRFIQSLVNIVIGLIEILLSLRILFKFLGASTDATFVRWLYANTEPLLAPFIGIFPTPIINGQFVIEFTSIVALVVYALMGYILIELLDATLAPRRGRN